MTMDEKNSMQRGSLLWDIIFGLGSFLNVISSVVKNVFMFVHVFLVGLLPARESVNRRFDVSSYGGLVRDAVDSVFRTKLFLSGEVYRPLYGGNDVAVSVETVSLEDGGSAEVSVFVSPVSRLIGSHLVAYGGVRQVTVMRLFASDGLFDDTVVEVAFSEAKRGFVLKDGFNEGTVLRFSCAQRGLESVVDVLQVEHVKGLPESVLWAVLESLKLSSVGRVPAYV